MTRLVIRFALFVAAFFGLQFLVEAVPVVFKDPAYSFQLLRALGATASGGADVGECLMTAYRITEGDDESWYREWSATATNIEAMARKHLAEGHRESAAAKYLRASNYYRSAEFFLHGNPSDPRILKTWGKSRECFLEFARLQKHFRIRPLEIPFEGTTLPGYLCLPHSSGRRGPLLLVQTGFDGTAEELFYTFAHFALRRGIGCLLFEGPGQGRVIREQGMVFRPDWETVVTPVVNYAVRNREADPRRIGLVGISFGGYLAPRAAAFEHRLKICVANGGVYDFDLARRPGQPPDLEAMLEDKETSEAIDGEIREKMKTNAGMRWSFNDGMWKFGAKTPSEWMRMTRVYTMKDCAAKVRCKMLVVDSEADKDMPGQARRLYEALRCPKDFMLFTAAEGAEEHCQMGALLTSSERILDWVEKNL